MPDTNSPSKRTLAAPGKNEHKTRHPLALGMVGISSSVSGLLFEMTKTWRGHFIDLIQSILEARGFGSFAPSTIETDEGKIYIDPITGELVPMMEA